MNDEGSPKINFAGIYFLLFLLVFQGLNCVQSGVKKVNLKWAQSNCAFVAAVQLLYRQDKLRDEILKIEDVGKIQFHHNVGKCIDSLATTNGMPQERKVDIIDTFVGVIDTVKKMDRANDNTSIECPSSYAGKTGLGGSPDLIFQIFFKMLVFCKEDILANLTGLFLQQKAELMNPLNYYYTLLNSYNIKKTRGLCLSFKFRFFNMGSVKKEEY